ncbi:S-methyl-5-thioribose-1-phosphate isomerase [Magnetococcales bacterium HHB-1]
MKAFRVVGWRDGAVEMLDQRALPFKEAYLLFHSAKEVAGGITDMVIRGAPAIGCAAAFGVAVEAFRLAKEGVKEDWMTALSPGLETIAKSRPTAVNLLWGVERMKKLIQRYNHHQDLPQRLLEEAELIVQEDIESCKAMGAHGAGVIPATPGRAVRIMTHCNAGALATAGVYGTALGVIRGVKDAGRDLEVIANETRPYLQGARLTAWELLQDQIEVTLITDNMAGYLMRQGEVDAIVVGADRVASNGDVANKIGTYTHAVVAKANKIPFFVACPISTIDMQIESGKYIPIEERSAAEVTQLEGISIAPEAVSVRHPAFDITPAELVTALITERGVIADPDLKSIKKMVDG